MTRRGFVLKVAEIELPVKGRCTSLANMKMPQGICSRMA